jgi:hypothetical protein
MSLTFPSQPSVNQLYTYGSNIWIWDGSAWEIYSNPSPTFNNVTITGGLTAAGSSTFSSGLTGDVTGNASTASALQTPRKINGTNFDGTADITIKTTTTTTSLTPPPSPANGDRWFNSNTGIEYIYLENSWVQPYTVSFGTGGGGGGGVNLSAFSVGANATPSGSGGIAYDNTTGVFTYTPPIITGYTLPTATVGTISTGTKGGVKVDGTSITISNGVISASAATPYTLPAAEAGTSTTGTLGGVIPDGTTITIAAGVITAQYPGFSGLSARTTVQTTTSSLTSGSSTTAIVQAAKGYALYSIQVDKGAWITIYTTTTAQSADSSRGITTDPTPGSGVIAEAITNSAGTTTFTPAVYGFNGDGTPSTNMYLKIYNNSGSTNAITVTITYLQLEV